MAVPLHPRSRRHLGPLVAFCAAVALLAGCGGEAADAHLRASPGWEAYRQGMSRVEAGDLEGAVAPLERALELDPDLGELRAALASAYRRTGARRKALETLEAGLAAAPDDVVLRMALGEHHWKESRFDAAAEEFEAAIAADPDHAAAHHWLGRMLVFRSILHLGSQATDYETLDRAIAELERACELAPDEAEHHYQAGLALARRHEEERALERFRAAVAADDGHALAHKDLGALAAKTGRAAEGRAALKRAADLKPDDPEILYEYGFVLEQEGDPDGARVLYEQAIALRPSYPDPHYRLGFVLQQQGEDDVAEAEFAEFDRWSRHATQLEAQLSHVRRNRDDLGAVLALARTYQYASEWDSALQWYRNALAMDSGCVEAYTAIGRIHVELQQLELGEHFLLEAVRRAPDATTPREHLARAYLEQGKLEPAEEQLAVLSRALPDDPQTVYRLGLVNLSQGERDEARRWFEQTLELDPDHVAARFQLANLLLVLEEWQASAAHYRRVLELQPGHARAQRFLELAENEGRQ